MRIPLLEWAEKMPSPEACADMTAQLLEYVRNNGGIVDPDCFEVETGETFGELCPVRTAADFHASLRPLKIEGNEGDGVFVAALVLYIMLTGSAMDMSMAKMLLIAAQTGQSTPLMHVPTSSLNELIEGMSDVNPGTRLSVMGALDLIAGKFPGSAQIVVTESQTGAEIQRTEVSLDKGETVWKPLDHYESGQQKFFPENSEIITIPYRLEKQTILCRVQPQKGSSVLESNIKGKRCFGIDIGSASLRISLLSEDGRVTDLEYNGGYSIPAVVAYRREGVIAFAEETDEPDMKNADVLMPFASSREDSFSARTAEGMTVQVSREELMKEFLEFTVRFMRDSAGYVPAEDRVALAVNTGCSMGWRNALISAAKSCGMEVLVFPVADAISAAYLAENPGSGRLMIVNAGYSLTDVSLADGAESLTPERARNAAKNSRILYAAPGGSAMNEMLAKSIKQTILMRTGVNLYQKDDQLTPSQYADNLRAVDSAAERIKCRLSFAANAEETITICGKSGEEKAELSYSRQQLDSMLKMIVSPIRTVAKQCLDSEKLSMSDVGTVILCGCGALMPAVQTAARELAAEGKCGFVMLYDVVSAARGAAILGGAMPENTGEQVLSRTESDIGTMTADVVSGLPKFHCLLPAGSEFSGESITFDYTTSLMQNELDSGKAVIKLYSRRAGMEHVTSILDPEGSAISYMGQAKVSVPEKFDFDSDRLCTQFTLDAHEKITASGAYLRKSKGFGKFLSRIGVSKEEVRGEYTVVQSGLSADYFPDKG